MHVIVKQALGYISNGSLPGKHHFFISFLTSHPGVRISPALKEKYPEEMTIVLQHQFENLQITDEHFSVVLSFDNVKEKIEIPFDALIAFADPSVKFGLQFSHIGEQSQASAKSRTTATSLAPKDATEQTTPEKTAKKDKQPKGKKSVAGSNVVAIDTFRKK